jgi:LuxR family maltose regulon positive regulatory protein
MHVGIAGVLIERGDLAAAGEHLAQSEGLGAHNGLPQNPYRSRVVAARLREAEGDLDSALVLLEEADRVYVGDYSPNVRPVPATRARLRLRRGELAAAEAWVAQNDLSAGDELSYLREYEHITLARVLLARYDLERDGAALAAAVDLIERLRVAAEERDRGGSLVEVLILQSLAHQRGGDMDAAMAALDRAVGLAQPEGYVRVFADEGSRMAALLTVFMKQPTAIAYVHRVLAATTRSEAPPARPPSLVAPLSERELEVLRLLGSDLGGPDIARALHVSLNTMRTHTKSIYAKLGVTSRRAAVTRARELGLPARQP